MKAVRADPAAERQRTAEIEWLAKASRTEWVPRSDGTGFDPVPALVRPELEPRIGEILCRPELIPILRIIERHNSQPREVPGRRLPQKDHFLLGPHLHQVLLSVQARNELRQRLPVLDQPAAEVRSHLQKVAADCKALAARIHRGPQPHVALAGETDTNDWAKIFARWTELFEAAGGSERQVVAFAALLERGGDWFDGLADHVPRASQNRHTGQNLLRVRAAEFLPGVFRKRLGRPHHAHVATIATLVSGFETDADFVKKAEAQQSGSKQRRGGESFPRKTAETLP